VTRRLWSNVLAVAYREALIVRHDPAYLGATLIQPLMLLLLYGGALSNKPANVPWVVLDRSQTAVARRLVADVQASGYFLPPRPVFGYGEGRRLLRRGRATAMLVIPKDFRRDVERGRPRVQLLLDGSDPLTSARVGAYISQVATAFQPDRPGDRRARAPAAFEVRQRFRFNPTLDDARFFLACLAGMVLTNLCFSATASGITTERETGTFEQTLSLPTSTIEIVLGKCLPHAVVALGLMVLTTTAAGLLFGFWPRGSWLVLLVVTVPFVLASLSIGVLVSALAKNSAQSVFITVFFIMPSFVLSGVMLPYQLMPVAAQAAGALLPLRWYGIALRRVITRGGGLLDIALPMVVLWVLFGVVLTAIRWRLKPRLA
jgi:ABC-2 type transport system permease protein